MCPEFRIFVEAAEKQLLLLFRSIDRDKDGRLNKKELQAAFQRAGLSVPNKRLSGFFDEIDLNNDGFITFDEWRYVCPCLCWSPSRWPLFVFVVAVPPPRRPGVKTHLNVDYLFFFVLFMSKVFSRFWRS